MRRLAAALLLVPAPALAQAYQCSVPQRIQLPDPPRPDGPVRRMAITGYTLAASWSPQYCRSERQGQSLQCSGRNGLFGFILHGLWPEGRSGWPQWCSLTPRPGPALRRQPLCMTPPARLLEHEWAKHGSCMTATPAAYFRTASILWRSIAWPDADRLSRRKGLTVGDLRREFVAANPDWRADQGGGVLTRGGWVQELRLCYGRNFMPAACPRGKLGAADGEPLKIWRGL
ncbi:MAG TPA: ribonuclease T [Novosphingobium sp.]|nr:ribonuclease T [Novosphingobium sp.]